MSLPLTRQKSIESTSDEEEEDVLETHPSVLISSVDENKADKPPFCLNEEQRKMKTLHERETDLNAAIEWIVKEIKILKQQDQNLMKQFVQLRGVLNSIQNCPPPMTPPIDRKISLLETSPNSPLLPPRRIPEKSSERYHRDEASPGLRRRAVSDKSGRSLRTSSMSSLSFDESDFTNENFEHFSI